MIDTIIVGFGLAGLAVAHHLEEAGKSVIVFDNPNTVKASKVAAGVYNPVILKRFTMAWNAHEYMDYTLNFYDSLSGKLGFRTHELLPLIRRFSSIQDQNLWYSKLDDPILSVYLCDAFLEKEIKHIKADFKYGALKNIGRLHIPKVLNTYEYLLQKKGNFHHQSFDYSSLKCYDSYVTYKGFKAKNIVFCEGYGVKNNPYFNNLPIVGNKGSYLILKVPDLKLKKAIKANFFLIPIGEDTYKFGATYKREFTNGSHCEMTKQKLLEAFESLCTTTYTVLAQQTGIRPTVTDRRPIIGAHKTHKNVYMLNGLGSRGVIFAPQMAKYLVDSIYNDCLIPSEVSISRFYSKVEKN